MNENDLSGLTYKELQALALKYRVPGNIKKHLLVRVLQAAQSGNGLEVNRILAELQQTRKKRMRKVKSDKMNVISTPIHSPSYTVSEECYYPQLQPPYQWVGAEEEIASREDDIMRIPNYEEFQQFLLRKIQQEYQSYELNEHEMARMPSIVDLRMGAGSSMLRPIQVDIAHSKSNIVTESNNYVQPSPNGVELQILEDANVIAKGPMLLKKMLEAPVGANLGQIASPDTDSYRIWSLEQYPNNSGNLVDDSDTLTAESDIENDDNWDSSNYNKNKNNNSGSNYYCIVNNNKSPLYTSQTEVLDKNIQEIGPLPNNFLNDGTNEYQVLYPIPDVQENCQKWIATNTFVNKDLDYAEPLPENSRIFHSAYYENTGGESTVTRPMNLDRKFAHGNVNYDAHHSILHGQLSTNDPHQYYQNNNVGVNVPINLPEVCYTQPIAKPVSDAAPEFYTQESGISINSMQNVSHSTVQSVSDGHFENGAIFQLPQSNNMQYHAEYYSQNLQEHNQSVGSYSAAGNLNQQQQQRQQHINVAMVPAQHDRKHIVVSEAAHSMTNGVLDSFWPRWPINATPTSNGQLESILNLQNYSYVDYTKIDQTSCVYCYTAPMVTQRIESPDSWCTQKKRFTAECRQHVFSPNRLVYNDASTGMRMANLEETVAPENNNQEPSNEDPSFSNTDPESEHRPSTDMSDSSMNDVWMNDYAHYNVSSENAGRSCDLTIDENEDDLFLAVRSDPQNPIDDETTENLNY